MNKGEPITKDLSCYTFLFQDRKSESGIVI